jgi:hypothetical protein
VSKFVAFLLKTPRGKRKKFEGSTDSISGNLIVKKVFCWVELFGGLDCHLRF